MVHVNIVIFIEYDLVAMCKQNETDQLYSGIKPQTKIRLKAVLSPHAHIRSRVNYYHTKDQTQPFVRKFPREVFMKIGQQLVKHVIT